jgi:hypothetical protein
VLVIGALIGASMLLARADADTATSRIYVVGYPCSTSPAVNGQPTATLYDQAFYGDSGDPVGTNYSVTITKTAPDEVDFFFDVRPGSYDAFIRFPSGDSKRICGRNGPLIAIPGKDRHLMVAGMSGITDWHSAAAIAGSLPVDGVSISVLQYSRQMRCGDDVRSFDPKTFEPTNVPRITGTTVDDRAYYANFHAYGKQNHTLALELSGALFSHGTILVTVTPNSNPHKPPFIEKDITAAVIHEAMAHPFAEKLTCIPGF